jgi:predicted RNA-binding protein YlxR (DUF448 family)
VIRSCVVCRREADRRELIRFVWSEVEGLKVDRAQNLPGRGSYLCSNRGCWQKGGSRLVYSLTGKKKQNYDLRGLLLEWDLLLE